MLVSDYILDYLSSIGIKHVFLITGGAIAFVVDAFHKRKDIGYVCAYHEQAAAMAADAYSRMGPGIAATMVTSGPGATNLITGICCSFFDSIPAIHITGQVNTFEQKGKTLVRQVGFQETDIVSIAKPVTKFAAQLDKPENIRYLLEKATYIAKSGRPGPVVLDIPQNFQRVEIDPKSLKGFKLPVEVRKDKDQLKLKEIMELIRKSKRPVLLAGGGIKLSGAQKEVRKLADSLKIPVVTSWSGFDLFPYDYKLRIGEIGVYGSRAANFAIQNADFILSVGSRLDTRQTGGRPETFARKAKIVMEDIDKAELSKRRGLTPYIQVHADAKEFINAFLSESKGFKGAVSKWLAQCILWRENYKVVKKEYYKEKKYVNPYVFIDTLCDELDDNAIIIPDDGANLTWTMQAFRLKEGQSLFSAFGNSPMGYAFPAAIGAAFSQKNRQVVCIDGDGSFQINIQELQSVAYHKLPIKIFILNNRGYGIIKQFQELYLGSRFEATGKGYSSPDFIGIAKAYKIKTVTIKNHKELRQKIKEVLKYKGPVVCDVALWENQKIIPKLEFGKSIEDLTPYLPREEFLKNMIVKPVSSGTIKGTGV